MNRTRQLLALTLLLFLNQVSVASSAVYSVSVKADFNLVYKQIYSALENNRLFVVFEPDIGSSISGFKQKWGKDYNQNKLEQIRSMVFCNAWYANQVSNRDVRMTAMCPLHITLTYKNGITSIHFTRPDYIAKGSPAEPVASELTRLVIKAIGEGITHARNISTAR